MLNSGSTLANLFHSLTSCIWDFSYGILFISAGILIVISLSGEQQVGGVFSDDMGEDDRMILVMEKLNALLCKRKVNNKILAVNFTITYWS